MPVVAVLNYGLPLWTPLPALRASTPPLRSRRTCSHSILAIPLAPRQRRPLLFAGGSRCGRAVMVKTTSETRPGPSPGPAKNVARREHMFIEVSGNGPTARPPKEVRSFVMRGARVQTNWSTRQKRPDAKPDQKPANTARNKKRGSSRRVSSASPRSGHEAAPSPEGLSTQHSGSPVSIASDSLTTTRSLSLPIFTTQSTPTTLCRFPGCNGFFCGMPPEAHAVSWDGFSVGFAADLDCLPVKADDKMRGLLRNCKSVHQHM